MKIEGFHGYNVKFSPHVPSELGIVGGSNFGMTGIMLTIICLFSSVLINKKRLITIILREWTLFSFIVRWEEKPLCCYAGSCPGCFDRL